MINKRKLQQTKDLQEFLILENEMLMSQQEFKENLKWLHSCARAAISSDDEEEFNFYFGLIKDLKNDMREQLNWLDSEERYHMMENLAQSDFVNSIFKMKRGDN